MKALIVPACTDLNRGDQALVWESARLLKDAGVDDVAVVDYGDNETDRHMQSRQTVSHGIPVKRNIVEHPRRFLSSLQSKDAHDGYLVLIIMALVAVVDFARLLLLLVVPSKFTFRILWPHYGDSDAFSSFIASDVIAVKGGGFLHTYGNVKDSYYIFFTMYYVLLGLRLRKKVVIFPNSIGPLTGRLNKLVVKFLLKRCGLVYVREKVSLSVLQELRVDHAKYIPDLAYFMEEEEPSEKVCGATSGISDRAVGITVRPYRFPEVSDYDLAYRNYVSSVAKFGDFLISRGYQVFFVVQVQGPSAHETDRIAINDVMHLMSSNEAIVIDGDYNCYDLMGIYSRLTFVVGTRFHSVIFSQNVTTPAIAIGYGGNKSTGIMGDLDLSEYVLRIEDINYADLKKTFLDLEASSDSYCSKLRDGKIRFNEYRSELISELTAFIGAAR